MKIQFRLRFINFPIPIVLLGLVLFSCKSINPAANLGLSTPPPPATTEVNVPLKIPKETLSKLLNSQIPTLLLQEKGMDMGSGMTGDLQLKRNGQISWIALDSQRIQLSVPINVLGQVGLKPKGLGSLFQSKLPLNEDFTPIFVIDPVINSNWSIGAESFELMDLGGNLAIDVLGMQVDLSGLLSKEIRKWGNQNLTGGKEIASLKTLVDLAWAQVGKPFSIDWIGGNTAFSIQPQDLKIKEFFDANQDYNLWLGMDGKINSHPADAAPSRSFPLPELSPNDNSTNELEILIPLTVKYSTLDELLKENLDGKAIRVDKKTTLIPSNIKTQAFGDLLAVNMDFTAEQTNGKILSGTLFVVGQPEYNAASQSLVFEDINFKMESGSLGAQTGVGLKKRKIIRSIETKAVFPIGDVLAESLGSITDRLGLNTPIAEFKIADLIIEPSGFYPMAKELVIHMKASGEVDVKWK
ncbi:uncharacterized protein DUF4403 [Algoriphagus ratkowskyi]|uniref:DUF4403 family protein n=1 Tax=Algoriphagus ratkowskyi TaxID=57028 RepID=A0A2W7RUR9_9BACT|nr:DUF4403 family protein [Algoriphagus ratkowskyi]PZX58379.1 uncharacterized protein DUF4403 [Algoriphagus ratkowskyi]TXD77753.1 DUF4403 family protein [Algoriphagus ratkowskyi]